MIQRIQTIYIFLLFVINLVLSLIDIDENSFINSNFFNFSINDFYFFEFVSILFFINIFMFKKLKVQLNFLRLTALLLSFLFLSSFTHHEYRFNSFTVYEILYFSISFVLIGLSLRSIKRDQKIISGSNRIR